MAEFIRPVNEIKEKVGDGGFTEAQLENAQRVIDENDIDFRPIANELLAEISDILVEIKAGQKPPTEYLSALQDPLMKLRGQGSLFRYSSLSAISDVIIDFLDEEEIVDEHVVEITSSFVTSARAVISLQIKHGDDETIQRFSAELKEACLRYHKKRT